jgi:hypothetical protein
LVLTAVLVEYLLRTDPLALALSAGWIILGGAAYLGLNRLKNPPEKDTTDSDAKITPRTED